MSDLMKFLIVGNQSFEVCDAAARAGIGSPLMAETVAEMTDTDKVYVYVGDETGYENGHWYYYDGSDWQDGGIYNSAAIVLDTTLSVAGEAADAKAVGDALAEKANIDGEYESMTVGNAEQLVATVGENNKTPYNFRTSGGSIDIGDREVDKLVGGTVAWNQLSGGHCRGLADAGVTITYDSTSKKFHIENTATATTSLWIDYTDDIPSGHKVLGIISNSNLRTYIGNTLSTTNAVIAISSNERLYFGITIIDGTEYNDDFYLNLFDLTQMFGSTIADYIYTLEQTTAGAGVAFFRKLFPDSYYAYNAGELMSVKTSAHVMTGFNQWDEETIDGYYQYYTGNYYSNETELCSKNFIPVLPNTTYYYGRPSDSSNTGAILFYDDNKNYISGTSPAANKTFTTPSNCHYIKFNLGQNYGATYQNNVCINLHWDGERDGEYEPYVKHEYALDSDLELRGLFKLDASNNLYCDGDTYESDGTVTRNYEYRAYASGDESLPDTITDGTHTVTKLTTSTTETADTYQNPQIVDDWGTEEYVDNRTVVIPVGHDTMYQANLRAKLEMMPNLPEVNGDYVLRQSASGAEYVAHTSPIPTLPSEDGTYVLKCTVADGQATLTWEAQS